MSSLTIDTLNDEIRELRQKLKEASSKEKEKIVEKLKSKDIERKNLLLDPKYHKLNKKIFRHEISKYKNVFLKNNKKCPWCNSAIGSENIRLVDCKTFKERKYLHDNNKITLIDQLEQDKEVLNFLCMDCSELAMQFKSWSAKYDKNTKKFFDVLLNHVSNFVQTSPLDHKSKTKIAKSYLTFASRFCYLDLSHMEVEDFIQGEPLKPPYSYFNIPNFFSSNTKKDIMDEVHYETQSEVKKINDKIEELIIEKRKLLEKNKSKVQKTRLEYILTQILPIMQAEPNVSFDEFCKDPKLIKKMIFKNNCKN